MFLSQLILNPINKDVRRDLANPYELHRTLMNAYPHRRDAASRAELLYRVEPTRNGSIAVLVQSAKLPDWSMLAADYADVHETKSLEGLRFLAGQQLRFRLRANPTKRLREVSTLVNGSRIEPQWAEKRVGLFREDDQRRWLERKAESGGFRLIGLQLIPEGLVRARKADKELSFISALFEGLLEVAEPIAFRSVWESGIGSGKGMGFGLLSLAAG